MTVICPNCGYKFDPGSSEFEPDIEAIRQEMLAADPAAVPVSDIAPLTEEELAPKRMLVDLGGGQWSAVQIAPGADGIPAIETTTLETPDAARWQRDAGFVIVPEAEAGAALTYAQELRGEDAARALRAPRSTPPAGAGTTGDAMAQAQALRRR